MLIKKNLILVVLVALMSIGCGTDGLETGQDSLSYTNSYDILDYIQAGEQYSFTVYVENGTVSNVNLTTFNEGGNWLDAQIVNNGSAIKLSGNPSSTVASTEFGYSLTAEQDNEQNAITSFSVYVDE